MRGRSSSLVEELGESDPSRDRTWPPREDEISWTTAPRELSLTKIVAIMTGSNKTAGAVSHACLKLVATAPLAAIEIAVGVESRNKCAAASS